MRTCARNCSQSGAERNAKFIVPQRGEKLRLLEMAMDNARQSFASRRDNEKTREQMLEDLRVKLGLRNTPKRMECYDISNLQGSMVVGSQVTFDEGEPCKNLYRRYRIRSFEGQDDFASMYEVLKRRLERAVRENMYPDLWVIDGGKGQLNVALEVLREFRLLDQIDCVSLAKQHVLNDRREKEVTKSEERVFVPQAQRSDRAAEELDRAVPARADSRRGASICDHLQPRTAASRAAAIGPRRYRRHRSGASARAAPSFRQPQADSRGDRR